MDNLNEFVFGVLLNRCILVVSFTLLYYDYALTVTGEITHFWWYGRTSIVSILFFLNRFLQVYNQYFLMVTQGIVVALLGMRTFALYERSKRIAFLLATIYLIMAVVAGWAIFTSHTSRDKSEDIVIPSTCNLSLTPQQCHRLAGIWGTEILFDLTVFALTLSKSLPALAEPPANGALSALTNATSSTLVSRMMLNLRETTGKHTNASDPVASGAGDSQLVRSMRFHGQHSDDEIEMEEPADRLHQTSTCCLVKAYLLFIGPIYTRSITNTPDVLEGPPIVYCCNLR
ncbi:hypothetical protein POSPLADRAFT_1032607 [Postia placenta MAD-698-R-SB12]|uniref:DUF6533 domain-containing protein n=1 Tax=Postia placenta MAD-698-R-SB12 TaxID=670580 RepID=A0A1X6N6E0_9APHY|nr:hypothetical protein POSPLADRAFT_1032607 [Postia placenta MAD-698-R-SB12]OSX64165.1 hypothetical protein POSPLADRAFT_1032607 [Postia placenta MAD-698-R-SB12]